MLSLHEMFLRLSVAALLGAVIGIERDLHHRPGGIRTSAFVCMGSALFTILSYELAKMFGDTSGTRIASNLVQGIGFLGARGIFREAGGGLYAVGGYATGVVLFGLICLGWVAQRTNLKARIMGFRITGSHSENIAAEVHRLLVELKIKPQQFRISMVGVNSIVEFQAEVSHWQQEQIVERLNRVGVVTEVTPI